MKKLKFAVFGTGFWSQFQIPGWLESPDIELVALHDLSVEKAKSAGEKYGVTHIYDHPEKLLEEQDLDFIDIITDVGTHYHFTEMAAKKGVNVVCQKPMAESLAQAQQLIKICDDHGVKLFINENFRWQSSLRRVKALMDQGAIGNIFKGRVSFCSAFPVFDNQPFLKELDRFILTDIGSHILDICRFLFGEADTLYCITKRVNPGIQGEDVANVLMHMKNGIHCFAEMSYASIREQEAFPHTLLLIEGEQGSIELLVNNEIRITTREGTTQEVVHPKHYSWADPDYALIHSSIVDTQMDIIKGLQGGQAETTGQDNYETVKLVWASYESAETNTLIHLDHFG